MCGWALGILGMSAATTSCINIFRDMYGTPTMDYEIKGRVIDAQDGKPVEGLEVSKAFDEWSVQAVLTDGDGRFDVSGQAFPYDTLTLKVVDIDGEKGGLYETQKSIVNLKQTEKGSGSWYHGKYEADNVEIKVKKASE